MRRALYVFLGLMATAYGFEEKPWLGNLWEFYLDTGYMFSRYDSVANSTKHLKAPSNNNVFSVDIGLVPIDSWDAAIEVDFAQTPRQSLGRRSVAAQVRTLWLNDIIGDFVSLTTGFSVRQTSYRSLHDISCPYSARWDFEINSAMGKEWGCGPNWCMRLYGLGAVGQGSRGSPWTRAKVAYQIHQLESHIWEFFSLGYWGFGRRREVNINHFNGWGFYDHSSIDLGFGYLYELGVWGRLRFDYSHCIHARVYPRGTNSFIIGYHLPFSLF
ncbi:MAG: hypothetical protein KGZ39_07140 [Simkania sp.]|nr:hypothetical protein [Simkania sp.]